MHLPPSVVWNAGQVGLGASAFSAGLPVPLVSWVADCHLDEGQRPMAPLLGQLTLLSHVWPLSWIGTALSVPCSSFTTFLWCGAALQVTHVSQFEF